MASLEQLGTKRHVPKLHSLSKKLFLCYEPILGLEFELRVAFLARCVHGLSDRAGPCAQEPRKLSTSSGAHINAELGSCSAKTELIALKSRKAVKKMPLIQ